MSISDDLWKITQKIRDEEIARKQMEAQDVALIREAIEYGQLADDMPYQLPKMVRVAIKRHFERKDL